MVWMLDLRQESQLLRSLIEPQYIVDFGKNKKCGIFILICTFHLSMSPKTYSRFIHFRVNATKPIIEEELRPEDFNFGSKEIKVMPL